MKKNYGKEIEKTLVAISWREDVTSELAQTKHILAMTNSLIKFPADLEQDKIDRLKEGKKNLEREIEIVTQDLNNDLFSIGIYN